MKEKPQPSNVQSPSNMEYHCLRGLGERGKTWAKDQIKMYKEACGIVPWGIIRQAALKMDTGYERLV